MNKEKFICINGKIITSGKPVISIENRSFRYGDALFETIRIANGKVQFLPEHIKRLKYGMGVLKMNVPAYYSVEYFEREILTLANKNGVGEGGRVRLTIFRNEGGFYSPENNNVSFVMEAVPLAQAGYSLNSTGIVIDIFTGVKKSINILSDLKTANCLCYILAGIYKTENMLDDCIILNVHDNIAEAISSNVFIVKNGCLYTPSLDEGCVAGIMRGQIILIAGKAGIKVNECCLSQEDLSTADEVFLTDAINGIRWVSAYKEKKYVRDISLKLAGYLNKLNFTFASQ